MVDMPSLFQEIFQLLISVMTIELGHMQFKVSVSVKVKRKCIIDNPILVWTKLFSFVQADLSRDDGELACPYFRSRQKIAGIVYVDVQLQDGQAAAGKSEEKQSSVTFPVLITEA